MTIRKHTFHVWSVMTELQKKFRWIVMYIYFYNRQCVENQVFRRDQCQYHRPRSFN